MTTPTDYILRYERYGLKDWIHRLYSTSFQHGSALAETLGTPKEGHPGLTDNCHASDQILGILVEAGWVVRADKPTPSREQMFFGWGGRTPGKRPTAATAYPSEFGYSPNYDSEGLLEYVRQ